MYLKVKIDPIWADWPIPPDLLIGEKEKLFLIKIVTHGKFYKNTGINRKILKLLLLCLGAHHMRTIFNIFDVIFVPQYLKFTKAINSMQKY